MKDFRKNSKIVRIRLNSSDLSELIALIKSGFPEPKRKNDFKISTNLSDRNISENELNDFLSHSDLPSIITSLNINLIGWSSIEEIDKYINLSINSYSELTICGADQTWVLGKHAQLLDYLQTKRPFLGFIEKYFAHGMISTLLFIVIITFIPTVLRFGMNPTALLLGISIFPLSLILYILTKMNNAVIIIRESQSFFDKYGNRITMIIALLSLLATLAIGIIQIIKK